MRRERGDLAFSVLNSGLIVVALSRWLFSCRSECASTTVGLLGYLVATAALPLVLQQAKAGSPHGRTAVVACYRLMHFVAMPEEALSRLVLHTLPTEGCRGLVVDSAKALLGSLAFRLFYVSVYLPLDMVEHLAVQTLCLALTVAGMPEKCGLSFMSCELSERRAELLHGIMPGFSLGLLPPGFPPGGRVRHCAAALDFLAIFVGWLLPTYAAACAACEERRPIGDAAMPSGGEEASSGAGGSSSAPAVRGAEACRPSPSLTISRWCMDNVFMSAAPPSLQAQAWCVLAALCWLAAAVLAMATAPA